VPLEEKKMRQIYHLVHFLGSKEEHKDMFHKKPGLGWVLE
jgi:hypothetical protein